MMIPEWFRVLGTVVLMVAGTVFMMCILAVTIVMVAGVINGLREEYRDRKKGTGNRKQGIGNRE